jgi:hypothetical protein
LMEGLYVLLAGLELDPLIYDMSMDPSVTCENSFSSSNPGQVRYAVRHGTAGVADIAASNRSIGVGIDKTGGVKLSAAAGAIPIGLEVPGDLLKGFEVYHSGLDISDAKVFVLLLTNKAGASRVLIFRRSDKTWRALPEFGGGQPHLRGFGRFIAITETQRKSDKKQESAGKDDWRQEEASMGPSVASSIRNSEYVYPGRLHIYDIEKERVYTITTNQADSEVLLVEGRTVYYRITDRIFSADIADNGLGPARLLTKAGAVNDAHWAFMKY